MCVATRACCRGMVCSRCGPRARRPGGSSHSAGSSMRAARARKRSDLISAPARSSCCGASTARTCTGFTRPSSISITGSRSGGPSAVSARCRRWCATCTAPCSSTLAMPGIPPFMPETSAGRRCRAVVGHCSCRVFPLTITGGAAWRHDPSGRMEDGRHLRGSAVRFDPRRHCPFSAGAWLRIVQHEFSFRIRPRRAAGVRRRAAESTLVRRSPRRHPARAGRSHDVVRPRHPQRSARDPAGVVAHGAVGRRGRRRRARRRHLHAAGNGAAVRRDASR